MALLASQKISRVLPGKPFGDGADGVGTISADPNTRETASGSLGSSTLTIGSAILSNGDVFMIHQTRGSGAGQWEINKVASGGGSTTITTSKPLIYDYLNTGNNKAQVIKIPRYTTATINAHSITTWNGTTGGLEIICASTSITGSGNLVATGNSSTMAGGSDSSAGGAGLGFTGGLAWKTDQTVQQGEGTGGVIANSTAANGNGGGGGYGGGAGGGGGGNKNAGSTATCEPGDTAGTGGIAVGSDDLISLNIGGAGGGGCSNQTSGNERSGGGAGGGIIVLISKSIDISAALTNADGGAAGSATYSGGGGAGGSILIVCGSGILGTAKVTASAGGTGGFGGAGSVGRITVHHSKAITGSTTPTFTDVLDLSLVSAGSNLDLTSKKW